MEGQSMKRTSCSLYLILVVLLSLVVADAQTRKYNILTYQDQQTGTWAFKLMIPDGWQFRGRLEWLPQPFKVSQLRFSVLAPGGSAGYEYYPDFLQVWSQNQQVLNWFGQTMAIRQPMTAATFLQQIIIPEYRSNVSNLRVIKSEQLQNVAQQVAVAVEKQRQSDSVYAQLTANANLSFDVARVDVTYNVNNVQYFETFMTRIIYTDQPGGAGVFWGPEEITSFWCVANQSQNLINDYVVMASSMMVNPLFLHKIYQINLMMVRNQQQQIRNVGELSRYISQTSDQINQMILSSIEYKDKMYDGVFRDYSEYTRGVECYHDADVTLEVPTVYEHVWRDGDKVIMSMDPNFNPNEQMYGTWEKMQKGRGN